MVLAGNILLPAVVTCLALTLFQMMIARFVHDPIAASLTVLELLAVRH